MTATAVVFPGQGAQHVGMGGPFHERFSVVRELFAQADESLGRPLSRLCLEGPEAELKKTHNCQPAIFLVGSAVMRALESEGRLKRSEVAFAAGLSLGEYTALAWAGAISFEDGLCLVARRGEAMQAASEAAPSGMVSLLGADLETAEAIADEARGEGEILSVANLLASGQVVLSGSAAACARVPEVAASHGVRRAVPLKVAGAFHSALMEPAAAALAETLERTEIEEPAIPVISNVDARPSQDPETIRRNLARQVTHPVRWQESVEWMIRNGVTRFLEPAPGKVLTGLLRKIDREVEGVPLDDGDALQGESGA